MTGTDIKLFAILLGIQLSCQLVGLMLGVMLSGIF